MRKRTWVYVLKPQVFEISCDKCGSMDIDWSEYEHMIWCYWCQLDTPGSGGVFDGPIGEGAARLLGLSFARYDMKKKCVTYSRLVGHHLVWFRSDKHVSPEERYALKMNAYRTAPICLTDWLSTSPFFAEPPQVLGVKVMA